MIVGISYAIVFVGAVAAQVRWLRVAQREHYLAGTCLRFALRWWSSTRSNVTLAFILLVCAAITFEWPIAGIAVGAVSIVAPRGLTLKGRTSKLAWTRRCRSLAVTSGALWAAPVIAVALLVSPATGVGCAAIALVLSPAFVELGLVANKPLERHLANRFVLQAQGRLRRTAPRVVAITGSFGKTSTKVYIEHLLSGAHLVLASPGSYNNQAGLARTVNEHLRYETEILIAEMGTYGPGEIAEMCSWLSPEIAVMTAIGPVHLERFGNLSVTLSSKAEITSTAKAVVLNEEDPLLATLIEPLESVGKRVITCSTIDEHADVFIALRDGNLELSCSEKLVGSVWVGDAFTSALSNVACAVGAVVALGDDPAGVLERLASLPQPPHRLVPAMGPSGVRFLDDTYNSNPVGAALALERLSAIGHPDKKKVLVTPGMVELGPLQEVENRRLTQLASTVCTHVIVVGRTNRSSLLAGVSPPTQVMVVDDREKAVAWVRQNLGEGDVVLYENDLPDHYA